MKTDIVTYIIFWVGVTFSVVMFILAVIKHGF
jgi:hypothetical protein